MPQRSRPPRLEQWSQIIVAEGDAHLVGIVSHHPRLRAGAPVVTSRLLWIAVNRRWARTESRLYALGAPRTGPLPDAWAVAIDRLLAWKWDTRRLLLH